MPIRTTELVGRLVADPRFSNAVKKDLEVVVAVLDLSPAQADLLRKVAARPDMSVNDLAREAVGSGHGIMAGG